MRRPITHPIHTTVRHVAHIVPPHDDNASGHVFYLRRVEKRAGGGFSSFFDAVRVSPTFLACKSEVEVDLWHFDGVRTSSTSLAYKSEPEVDLHCVLTPFARPPPPSREKPSRRWVCSVSTVFARPPPPSHANASWRWVFIAFRRRSRMLHLPRMQTRAGGGFFNAF